MLAKLALLAQSKVALAVVGSLLVVGTGATVATAATGGHPFGLNLTSHNDATPDATHENDGIGKHDEVHGVVASVNVAGGSFTITVKGNNGQSDDHGTPGAQANDDHGTPTTKGTPEAHGTPTAKPTPKGTPTTTTVTVKTDANTKFEGVAKALADFKVGMQAEVGGTKQTDGSFVALKVETGAADTTDNGGNGGDDGQGAQSQDFSGVITVIAADHFTVKGESSSKTVTVSSATVYDGVKALTDLKVGMRVEVKGTLQNDGSIAATSVHAEDAH